MKLLEVKMSVESDHFLVLTLINKLIYILNLNSNMQQEKNVTIYLKNYGLRA